MLLRSRIPRCVPLLFLATLLLRLEPPVARRSDPAHLDGLRDLILQLVLIVVVIVDGFLHLAPSADDILFLVFVVVHLIVNFFIPVVVLVVVEGIIYVLLFDLVLVVVCRDTLHNKPGKFLIHLT